MSLTNYPAYPNKAHQRAYANGIEAADAGKDRFPPYDCGNRSSRYFRQAWLAGYDGRIDATQPPRPRGTHDDE